MADPGATPVTVTTAPAPTPSAITARRAATAFVALSALLAVWIWASHRYFGASADDNPITGWAGERWLGGWVHYDGGWYRSIAFGGYHYIPGQQSSVAFFPGYPLIMALLAPVFGNVVTAGIAVTFLAGLGAVVGFARWCRDRLSPAAQQGALALLLFYPYAWFLSGAVYADALFLCSTVWAFVALERGRTVTAGLAGFVAAATRPVGPAVVIALVVRQLERRDALRYRTIRGRWTVPWGIDRTKLSLGDGGVLLSAGGFLAYCGYLWVRWGDPFLFNTVQKYWKQGTGPVTWFKLHLGGIILLEPRSHALYIPGCILQGLLSLGALALAPKVVRRFGWGYGALVGLAVAVPVIGSKDFQGLGRYLLVAFPVFAYCGEWLAARPFRQRAWLLGASAVGLLFWSHLYARGFYVA